MIRSFASTPFALLFYTRAACVVVDPRTRMIETVYRCHRCGETRQSRVALRLHAQRRHGWCPQ